VERPDLLLGRLISGVGVRREILLSSESTRSASTGSSWLNLVSVRSATLRPTNSLLFAEGTDMRVGRRDFGWGVRDGRKLR
jgi:hypothetical protein